MNDITKKLKTECFAIFEWFENLKANSGKLQVMLKMDDDKLETNVGCSLIYNETTVKLLGVTVANKLSFEPHLNTVRKKVSHKLHALARVSNYISQR